jgi:vacuolar protein sorting-associated protein 13A/C
MFEGKLTSVLNKLLGEYVHGISAKDLSVAVFKGDVVLKNLRLKTEALNALDLPFAVRSGLVGKLSLQIPWRALGKQPVVATIERLYVVAGFADDVDGEPTRSPWRNARNDGNAPRRSCADARSTKASPNGSSQTLRRMGRTTRRWTRNEDVNAKGGDGWLAGMLDTVLGNLEVNISKIHVRLEGDLAAAAKDDASISSSNSSKPDDCFAAGVTLESLTCEHGGRVGYRRVQRRRARRAHAQER